MTNVARYYVGYAELGAWFQRIAAEFGKTPPEFFMEIGGDLDPNPLALVKTYSIGDGLLTAQLRGDVILTAQFDPQTLTVTHITYSYGGQTALQWEGQMSAAQFLTDDWPPTVYYGSPQADVLEAWSGDVVYGGAGNDLLVLAENNAKAYGQAGTDTFLVDGYGHMTIGDYQPGEKIVFMLYENLAELAADFRGVQAVGNGFRVLFKSAQTPDWSLTFENLRVEQLRLDDLAFATHATLTGVYQPVFQAFGLNMPV